MSRMAGGTGPHIRRARSRRPSLGQRAWAVRPRARRGRLRCAQLLPRAQPGMGRLCACGRERGAGRASRVPSPPRCVPVRACPPAWQCLSGSASCGVAHTAGTSTFVRDRVRIALGSDLGLGIQNPGLTSGVLLAPPPSRMRRLKERTAPDTWSRLRAARPVQSLSRPSLRGVCS